MEGRKLIRIGQVSSVNRDSASARVAFSDLDNVVSADLPIIRFGPARSMAYWFPEVGDMVLCVFLPTGTEEGFVIGSYQQESSAPFGTEDQDGRWWDDGTAIYYDYINEVLVVNSNGPIQVTAPNVVVTAAERVEITSPTVQINGNLNVTGNITGGNT